MKSPCHVETNAFIRRGLKTLGTWISTLTQNKCIGVSSLTAANNLLTFGSRRTYCNPLLILRLTRVMMCRGQCRSSRRGTAADGWNLSTSRNWRPVVSRGDGWRHGIFMPAIFKFLSSLHLQIVRSMKHSYTWGLDVLYAHITCNPMPLHQTRLTTFAFRI